MKAAIVVEKDSVRHLTVQDVPTPIPTEEGLMIQVKAAGVNRADIFRVKGTYPAPKLAEGEPEIIGGEAAGWVVETGKKVQGFRKGDRVMGMCNGGYAEITIIHQWLAIPIPERLSFEEAAAIPIGFMTEHNALRTVGGLKNGESVLINGASSGVGVSAVQIAKFFGAKPVIVLSGSDEKLNRLKQIGADVLINYRVEAFKERVLKETEGKGVDLIIDHVGGPFLKDNLKSLALKGRLVSVGRLGGEIGSLNMDLLAYKQLKILGVTFRTRTMSERVDVCRQMMSELLPPLGDGRLQPVVDRVFSLEEASEAHRYMQQNHQFGKIIIKI